MKWKVTFKKVYEYEIDIDSDDEYEAENAAFELFESDCKYPVYDTHYDYCDVECLEEEEEY